MSITVTDADIERIMSKTDVGGPDECWEWSGYIPDDATASVWLEDGSCRSVRRVVYAYVTDVDTDAHVYQTCDEVDVCVNPAHLSEKPASSVGCSADNRAKLTEADVVDIRERVAAGEKQSSLADEYDIDRGTVSRIVNGKRWLHAGGPIKGTTYE